MPDYLNDKMSFFVSDNEIFSNFGMTNTAIKQMGKHNKGRKRKHIRKRKEDQNLLTIIIAVIVVILLIVAYLTWQKKKHVPPVVQDTEPLPIDPRYERLADLKRKRDLKHLERYLIYKKICDLNTVEKWCEEQIDWIFKLGRWFLFLFVLSGFIVTWFDSLNFLGWSTSDFLKGINAVGVLIFLLYFASSDANDSLMRCYHNSKELAVKYFVKVLYWYYKKRYKINKDNEENLKENLKLKFMELKSIIDEIRDLENSLS